MVGTSLRYSKTDNVPSNSTAQLPSRPQSNPIPSFWTSQPQPLDDHRSTPTLPPSASIVIIGGGFSGIATAYHLLNTPNPPSIVLLEARKICSGATAMYGLSAAAELASFEAVNVYAVKELVEKEGLREECEFQVTRAVDVYLDEAHARQTEEAYRELMGCGGVDMRDIAFVSRKDAEKVSGVKGAHCAFSFTAAHLWPLKFIHGLLRQLLTKGPNVQANTPVTSISPAPDAHGNWTVHTPRGSISTPKVIYATNAYTCALLPSYARAITPIRGFCSHIAAPRGSPAPHLVNTYARSYDYLIPRTDGSIVVGGARQRFWHAPEHWFGTVRDDKVIDEAVSYFDGYMQRHFRGWEDSGAKTENVWTGILGYSADYMPHVGCVPGKPGQFVIAAFNGHGMPQILLSTKGLAKMVGKGVPFEETGMPRIFKTTKERIDRKDSPLEESFR
ncbi:DAO-domain-containing protein [Bimuria novae-zelandiae CBS 107.79]|uniref:DAO-domain-containing protein n=1 Tax=Bimuria novae-zelandiae CBS 107.79 TaxID=1447943 RepID=A0A6A5UXI3_9PLEO|nr:DAO-domain-containing protein [Bimuria novae-zelandiae CBS 107.79]